MSGLDVELDEISLKPSSATEASSFVYHRINSGYERIHKLCALFLDAASLSEAAGSTDFRTFLLDMNDLYEHFITQSLLDRVPAGWAVSPQESRYLDVQDRVPLRPDLVVRQGGEIVLVADCKYKPLETDSDRHNADLYQLLAYCTTLNVPKGLLIYPLHAAAVLDRTEVRNSDIELRRLTVNLRGSVPDMRAELDALGEKIWGDLRLVGDTAA